MVARLEQHLRPHVSFSAMTIGAGNIWPVLIVVVASLLLATPHHPEVATFMGIL